MSWPVGIIVVMSKTDLKLELYFKEKYENSNTYRDDFPPCAAFCPWCGTSLQEYTDAKAECVRQYQWQRVADESDLNPED